MAKKLIIAVLMLTLSSCFAFAEKPEDIKITGFVNDYAGILSAEEKAAISTVLKNIYDPGAAEFSVVVVNSLDGQDIESFAYSVAEGKLGDKEKNNGLLLLVSIEDRKYRFEVGRGIEPMLNDAKIGRIGRQFLIPNFRSGDYYTGIYSAVNSVESILLNQTNSEYYVNEQKAGSIFNNATNIAAFLLPLLFMVLIFIRLFTAYKRAGSKTAKRSNDDYLLAAWGLSTIMRGRGGFGGGSGGFGGFGGGSFGGGGSSGGW